LNLAKEPVDAAPPRSGLDAPQQRAHMAGVRSARRGERITRHASSGKLLVELPGQSARRRPRTKHGAKHQRKVAITEAAHIGHRDIWMKTCTGVTPALVQALLAQPPPPRSRVDHDAIASTRPNT